jgi:hypothetical protein
MFLMLIRFSKGAGFVHTIQAQKLLRRYREIRGSAAKLVLTHRTVDGNHANNSGLTSDDIDITGADSDINSTLPARCSYC